jgi:hypothetical protein
MPITIRFKKTDEHGNTYYEDLDGNRIVELEPSPEEIAAKDEEYYRWVDELNRQHRETERKAKPFVLKALGNLQRPKPRKLLWKNYWATNELCILAGDNGVGKSLMALQVAKELTIGSPPAKEGNELGNCEVAQERGGGFELTTDQSTTHPLPQAEGLSTPPLQGESLSNNKVLYIDWELTEEDFVQRWGGGIPIAIGTENFFWAGFNADSEMPQHVPDKIDWLLQNFTTTVKETEANILIIDQPDRLHLSPQKWNEFLTKLKALMRTHNLSVMLVVSNKPRHTGRPCGLNNIPKGSLLIPVADSVIMMCQNQRRTCERYFKVLKNRNRAVAENIEEVDIVELEEYEGVYQVHPWGRQAEKSMLPPNASERKNQQIMQAEKLWNSGLSCLEVAEQMYVAEATVKSWLRLLSYPPQPLPTSREGQILPRRVGGDVDPDSYREKTEGVRNGESRLLHPVIN